MAVGLFSGAYELWLIANSQLPTPTFALPSLVRDR